MCNTWGREGQPFTHPAWPLWCFSQTQNICWFSRNAKCVFFLADWDLFLSKYGMEVKKGSFLFWWKGLTHPSVWKVFSTRTYLTLSYLHKSNLFLVILGSIWASSTEASVDFQFESCNWELNLAQRIHFSPRRVHYSRRHQMNCLVKNTIREDPLAMHCVTVDGTPSLPGCTMHTATEQIPLCKYIMPKPFILTRPCRWFSLCMTCMTKQLCGSSTLGQKKSTYSNYHPAKLSRMLCSLDSSSKRTQSVLLSPAFFLL